MADAEVWSSNNSDNDSDEEKEAYIQRFNDMRQTWNGEMTEMDSNLQLELRTFSSDYRKMEEKFSVDVIDRIQKLVPKAAEKMRELRQLSQDVSVTQDESLEERELQEVLQQLNEQLTLRHQEKLRLLEQLAGEGRLLIQRLRDTRAQVKQKELAAATFEAQILAAFRVFGIHMGHKEDSPGLVKVDFRKMALLPGVEAGLLLNCQADKPTLVKHWPDNPKMPQLVHQLDEDGPDGLTRFLIAARESFREQCHRTDTNLRANLSV